MRCRLCQLSEQRPRTLVCLNHQGHLSRMQSWDATLRDFDSADLWVGPGNLHFQQSPSPCPRANTADIGGSIFRVVYQAVNLVGLKLLVLFLCGSWNPSSVILSLAIACPIQDSQKFGQRLYSDFEAPLPGTRLTRTLPSSFGRDCACPKFCPLVLEARKICWCSTKVLVPFYLVTKVWPSLRLRAVEMLSSFHSKCQVPSQVSAFCPFSSAFGGGFSILSSLWPLSVGELVPSRIFLSCTGSKTPGSDFKISVFQGSFHASSRPG